MNLQTHLQFTNGQHFTFTHDLQPILAVSGKGLESTTLQWPSLVPRPTPLAPFPPETVIDTDIRLPNTLFFRGFIPLENDCTWERTIITHIGIFCAIFDRFRDPSHLLQGREDTWEQESHAWVIHKPKTITLEQSSAIVPQLCLNIQGKERLPIVDLVEDHFFRLAKRQEGSIIGLGKSDEPISIRNIQLQAEAFWIDQSHFSLLKATELSYLGRKILEADQPVSIEFDLNTGMGEIEGKPKSRLLLHGGNMPHEIELSESRMEIEITGFSRKSDWWNVVMGAVQKLTTSASITLQSDSEHEVPHDK